MEINRLRSIIRESISNNLKEIEDVAENAAMEAKLNAYTEAIEKVNKKIEMAESLEEMQELVDPTKLNELKKHLKTLEKSKEKLEKVKAKKNKGKEVVTDEPVDESAVEEGDKYNPEDNWNDAELDDPWNAGQTKHQPMDEEEAINESFLKMQKLAGVITEAQYNSKKSLIENENKKFTSAIEFPGGYHLNITDKMKQDIKNQLGVGDEDIKFGYEEDSQDRGTWFATIDVNLENIPADKKSSYKDIISKIVKPAKTDDKTPPTNSPKIAKSGLLNKIKSAFSK
jgi:hypothetical protein